jgi:hypothetical protein
MAAEANAHKTPQSQRATRTLSTTGPSDDAHGLSSSSGRSHVLRHLISYTKSALGPTQEPHRTAHHTSQLRNRAYTAARQTVDPDLGSSPGTSASHA